MSLKLPGIAKGPALPYSVQEKIAKEEQNRKEKNKLLIINILINIACTVLGAILGKLL